MSTFNDLEKRIKETEEIMRLCKNNHRNIGLPEYLSTLEITSLQLWSDQLKREQQAEESRSQLEELEIKIDDKKIPSGQISVRTLTTILADLQSLTDSIANTLYNQPSNRGPIPQEIMDSNSWILKTVKAGSFIAVLQLKHEHQLLDDEIPQRQMMIELFNLFHASDEEESLSEMISKLGMRTLKYYTEWTKDIRNLDVPVELVWKTKNGEVSTVGFDTEKAGRIFTILNERLTLREEETSLEGRLTGVNVRIGSFELIASDGAKITGRIIKDTVPKIGNYLGQKCKAELLKITTQSSAGKEKISWILSNIHSVE